MNKKLIVFSSFMLAAFMLSGCANVLLTQRQQLLLVSDADMQALGAQQYNDTLSKSKLITSESIDYQRVVRVGKRITAAVDGFVQKQGMASLTSGVSWEFNLIDDANTINAFCMPGGKIAVYSGILPVTKNDVGLAVVLSHEIAHALAKHGDERLSQILLVQYGGETLSKAITNQPVETQKYVMLAFGLGTDVGVLLPYSRAQESEADHIGLIMMAYAGYDPHEAIKFWDRMEKLESGTPLEFLSTHPLSSERIKDITAEIPEAMKYYHSPTNK